MSGLVREAVVEVIKMPNMEELKEHFRNFVEKQGIYEISGEELEVVPYAFLSHQLNADLVLPNVPEFADMRMGADEILSE